MMRKIMQYRTNIVDLAGTTVGAYFWGADNLPASFFVAIITVAASAVYERFVINGN